MSNGWGRPFEDPKGRRPQAGDATRCRGVHRRAGPLHRDLHSTQCYDEQEKKGTSDHDPEQFLNIVICDEGDHREEECQGPLPTLEETLLHSMPRFVCAACGRCGADVRPDFHWNKLPTAAMGYR